jgi:hypothetical protein
MMINTALRLPAPEIEALLQGRIIAVMPNKFIFPGREFALCPTDESNNLLPIEQYYRSSFLPTAQSAFTQFNDSNILIQTQQINLLPDEEQLQLPLVKSEIVLIKAWARCELCQILNDAESLASLSKLTIWTQKGLQEIITQRKNIFLAYLRVYQLPQPIEVVVKTNSEFVQLPNALNASEANPVLSEQIFNQRKHQLENFQPPLHPELEELQNDLSKIAITNPAAQQLENNIKIFLGWSSEQTATTINSDLSWTKTIASLGNRSKEQDEGKSNYQAGTDFENIVRKSLEFLGFKVDYFHKGGAGGVDVFCSHPYPLIAECKAGRKIPNDTAVQLLNLGTLRLKSQELFQQATKLIIGPGEPTTQLAEAAKIQNMAIINPETLEKLVKLQSNYRNSIDLFKLKNYLKFGQTDQEVEKYIQQVEQDIKLRYHIIQLVKKHLEKTGAADVKVDALKVAYIYDNPPQNLEERELYEILIELSSPLTGYLGREKSNDWKTDKFYYLRDLPTT